MLEKPQTAQTPPLLQAEGLSFGYGDGDAPPLFDGVSLSVAPRETVCLLGGSGCGKSTLLRVLARLAVQRAGTVRFEGQPLQSPHPRAALVFQQPGLLPWLNVARNVAFGLAFKHQPRLGTDALRRRADDALAAVGLAGQGALYPAQLSGGMAQRVALARALAREPALLLADEPFSALDAITRAGMQRLLVEVTQRRHAATLLVTHDVDEALLVADRILLMGGRPGGVLREWAVAAPRPRERHMADLTALRLDILGALQASHAPHAPHAPAAPA
ncbi:ABC transporter ATP-binding protein [Xylophilus sp. Leaf220]|uniref:ABC transporter ATP-binding protein n=1 Tax=Xylophilus sp. Leaf220 TaxID=1735686 RepID=UPI0006F73576|nr:ABC transporter ATP-binding protein [Xylophilus sp. Leaf220]KQM76419.1 ABC transporter ATP-binding protein [Xylophilus sp. Leaf220]